MAAFLEDEDSVVSIKDIVDEEQALQDTANAVLGDSDDTNCTYTKGYVSRQALYACSTCTPSSSVLAGFCLACSLRCHEGHDVIELYTKRNFRCDCGNSKISGNPCLLCPDKDPLNSENIYNHNFNGLYCTCNRPYPDLDDEVEDEMIQCSVCEDWYHTRHLGLHPPNSFEETVCDKCMSRLSFLYHYKIHSVSSEEPFVHQETLDACTSTTHHIESEKTETHTAKTESDSIIPNGKEAEPKTLSTDSPPLKSDPVPGPTNESQSQLRETETCVLEKRKTLSSSSSNFSGPGYFTSQWRSELCSCSSCKKMYKELSVEFLLDTLDSITSYETRAKSTGYIHDVGMEALSSSMGRVQQVEMINGYNHMKEELKKFLGSFASKGKVVRPRDITDFFGELENQKRQRLEYGDGIPPDSC
ncbi:PREDICTED: putative E3 ubiquitin-protein ligase UBR7 [Amphimedon queenslandica]|uniref:UBR-type domain-containing protein n=1 Tax=Amphimedon queenslandica TaxID=400682 RepID=A0A1X7VLC3_AMPQE|nr:PREDICTED: putative E3 ubiquitin-protein ligase UBR7 [Amphimedon queenslandica]|eukprot:XP_003383846.1 PREDICTED: putative E3 ubiquitin-protein ligase UBR7 [Amphimedon queenslandica]